MVIAKLSPKAFILRFAIERSTGPFFINKIYKISRSEAEQELIKKMIYRDSQAEGEQEKTKRDLSVIENSAFFRYICKWRTTAMRY